MNWTKKSPNLSKLYYKIMNNITASHVQQFYKKCRIFVSNVLIKFLPLKSRAFIVHGDIKVWQVLISYLSNLAKCGFIHSVCLPFIAQLVWIFGLCLSLVLVVLPSSSPLRCNDSFRHEDSRSHSYIRLNKLQNEL